MLANQIFDIADAIAAYAPNDDRPCTVSLHEFTDEQLDDIRIMLDNLGFYHYTSITVSGVYQYDVMRVSTVPVSEGDAYKAPITLFGRHKPKQA